MIIPQQQGTGSSNTSVLGQVTELANTVIPGAQLISGLITTIGALFGIGLRGDLQKFQRTVYPYMRTLAAKTGYPVFAWWFGEYVRVNPDGGYGSAGDSLPTLESYYFAACKRSDDDCVNHPADLVFEPHINEAGQVLKSAGQAWKWILGLGGIGAAAFFMWGKK